MAYSIVQSNLNWVGNTNVWVGSWRCQFKYTKSTSKHLLRSAQVNKSFGDVCLILLSQKVNERDRFFSPSPSPTHSLSFSVYLPNVDAETMIHNTLPPKMMLILLASSKSKRISTHKLISNTIHIPNVHMFGNFPHNFSAKSVKNFNWIDKCCATQVSFNFETIFVESVGL